MPAPQQPRIRGARHTWWLALFSLAVACQSFLSLDVDGVTRDAGVLADSTTVLDAEVDGDVGDAGYGDAASADAMTGSDAGDAPLPTPAPDYSRDAGAGCPPAMAPSYPCTTAALGQGAFAASSWNGRCYFTAGSSASQRAGEALARCKSVHPDAYVATFTCSSEWQNAGKQVGMTDITWLGGGRASPDSGIEWQTGEPFSFHPWGTAEPNATHNCLLSGPNQNYLWSLAPCSSTAMAVCELGTTL